MNRRLEKKKILFPRHLWIAMENLASKICANSALRLLQIRESIKAFRCREPSATAVKLKNANPELRGRQFPLNENQTFIELFRGT